jgi:hypothetical protein
MKHSVKILPRLSGAIVQVHIYLIKEQIMAKVRKNKKTYKELIKEIKFLESIVIHYREYLERMGILIDNYIEMNGDTEKLINYIEEKGKNIENKWNKKT